MHSNIPSVIKNAVTMTDLCERYGITINRAGFAVCPFHHEKTPSMKIYGGDKGFYCFGCGKSGDVIAFVQEYFNLSFPESAAKINADFGLNLPLERKMSLREKRDLDRREQKRRARQAAKQAIQQRYFDAYDRWIALDKLMREYRPSTVDEELRPEFVGALFALEEAEFELEEAESEMRKNEVQN